MYKTILALMILVGSMTQVLRAADDNLLKIIQDSQKKIIASIPLPKDQRKQEALKIGLQLEQLIQKYDLENGYLYYNTGNAFFYAEDLGKAMLYYQKAKHYIPGFEDLNENLNLLENRLQIVIDSSEQNPVLKFLRSNLLYVHFQLDMEQKIGLLWLLMSLFLVLSAVNFFYKSLWLFNLRWFSVFLLILQFLSVKSIDIHRFIFNEGVVVKKYAEFKKGPGQIYEDCYQKDIPPGLIFSEISQREHWVKIKTADDNVCWVKKENTQRI